MSEWVRVTSAHQSTIFPISVPVAMQFLVGWTAKHSMGLSLMYLKGQWWCVCVWGGGGCCLPVVVFGSKIVHIQYFTTARYHVWTLSVCVCVWGKCGCGGVCVICVITSKLKVRSWDFLHSLKYFLAFFTCSEGAMDGCLSVSTVPGRPTTFRLVSSVNKGRIYHNNKNT